MKRLFSFVFLCVISFFLPQSARALSGAPQAFFRELVKAVVPAFAYQEELGGKEAQLTAEAEFENKQAAKKGNALQQDLENESAGAPDPAEEVTPPEESGSPVSEEIPDAVSGEAEVPEPAASDADSTDLAEKLQDFDYLIQNYYIVDSSTTVSSADINAKELLEEDLSVDPAADGPQILIYHTHSQEGYRDSVEGDASTSVVALGEVLTQILTEEYGFRVLHHTGEYDVNDRDHAYSNAAPVIQELLAENPTIEVVIDLHRDSVAEETHLVTTIDGKETAKIMFFNGLCRTTASGNLERLQNPYLADNLAFSLQMQLAAEQEYPDLTRKIYLKGYRYNMHFCPKTLLVEVGAQNNTFEEAQNAMEPLAKLLSEVLSAPAS